MKIISRIHFLPIALITSVLPAHSYAAVSLVGILDHFDPNLGVTTGDAGEVTGWANQADGSRNASASTTTTTVAAGPNGTMLNFNSGQDTGQLRYTSPSDAAMSDGFTIFAVVSLDVSSTNPFPRAHTSNTDSHALFYRNSDDRIDVKANPIASPDRPVSNWDGELTILTARVTPTSQELYFNGTLVDSNSIQIGDYQLSDGDFWIGNSWKGLIGDILVYDDSPTDADLGQTGASLAQSYGLSWDHSALVPEPSAALLLGLGFLGTALRRRR
ncbi:LamG-like jellyroll fold domain-containing protein [Verrucomicrobiaceae bacterium 227]